MLRDIDETGGIRDIPCLEYGPEFMQTWNSIPRAERRAIVDEVNRRLDTLISSSSPNWGSIMNTSIEGGTVNPNTGVRGDWSGAVFHPIYVACGYGEQQAGMFYGNVWKKLIIDRAEQ